MTPRRRRRRTLPTTRATPLEAPRARPPILGKCAVLGCDNVAVRFTTFKVQHGDGAIVWSDDPASVDVPTCHLLVHEEIDGALRLKCPAREYAAPPG